MDPLASAGIFATIVGLLCNFKTERSGGNLDNFIEWLREKHHEDVVVAIQRDARLVASLSSILTTNHTELMDRVGRLDEALCAVAAHVGQFSSLARAVRPELGLSEQAVSIVSQLVESEADAIWEMKVYSGGADEYLLMGGVGQRNVQYDEPRFIDDDLNALCDIGFLRLEIGSKGTRKFGVTRAAAAFIKALR